VAPPTRLARRGSTDGTICAGLDRFFYFVEDVAVASPHLLISDVCPKTPAWTGAPRSASALRVANARPRRCPSPCVSATASRDVAIGYSVVGRGRDSCCRCSYFYLSSYSQEARITPTMAAEARRATPRGLSKTSTRTPSRTPSPTRRRGCPGSSGGRTWTCSSPCRTCAPGSSPRPPATTCGVNL
jgi:hypothetical protein